MNLSDIPARVAIRFGESAGAGFIRPVPVASQVGANPGAASFTDGFPPATFTAISGGGAYVNGEDMNGILQYVTAWNRWQAAGGPAMYNAAFCTSINGYPNRAMLVSSSGAGTLWLNTVDGNLTDPDGASAVGWARVGPVASTQAQVDAGTDTTTFINPALLKVALAGVASHPATLEEAKAGTNNTDFITPLVLAQLLGRTDSQTFTLPGGLIIKMGRTPINGGSNSTFTGFNFATPFPNSFLGITGSPDNTAAGDWSPLTISFPNMNTAGGTIAADTTDRSHAMRGGLNVMWIAWGT